MRAPAKCSKGAPPQRPDPVKLLERRHSSFRYQRLRSRLRRGAPPGAAGPPQRPVGAKLELTYSCNLRCAFCYTDSPRRTLQRSIDLSDEEWLRITDEAIDLGVIEAVVTGGEPLLRRDLTLEVIDRLTREGIGVALNTNGWFIDDEVADRLAAAPGLTVHVSIDGATPSLHDGQRGVPGSWRRAVEAIDRLLSRGVGVCVVHVVTPENEAHLDEMLEQMWALGVPWLRPTQVALVGAAARSGEWSTSTAELRRTIEEFRQRRGTGMRIDLRGDAPVSLARHDELPPASLLVRPAGSVRTDSMRPFTYGNAARDGLANCWDRIAREWLNPVVGEWAAGVGAPEDLRAADPVPYLDEEVDVAQAQSGEAGRDESSRNAPLPPLVEPKTVDLHQEMAEAQSFVRGLATARPYRLGPVRAGGDPSAPVLRHASGRYLRLNHTAAVVMRALDSGTPLEAARALRRAYPEMPDDAEAVALGTARQLAASEVVRPARATGPMPVEPGASDLPGLEPDGT